MATVSSSNSMGGGAVPLPSTSTNPIASDKLPPTVPGQTAKHRIAEVREEQGISLRTVSRRTGVDVAVLRAQEDCNADIRLSDLYRWQSALEVPVSDLLLEGGSALSPPIRQRAQLVKIMKTALSILENAPAGRVARLSEMLREQLLELMPELEEVVAWPNQGSRRPSGGLSKIVENTISLGDVACNVNND
jgi:transcriptional regulator with XRE-family HTH domain